MRAFIIIFLATSRLLAASFLPWEPTYGLWLPPTLRGEPPAVEFVSGYPFEAPSAALDTSTYAPIAPKLSALDYLAGNVAFFSRDNQPPQRQVILSIGNTDYPLPPEITLDSKTVFPVEGLLRLSDDRPTLLWNSYAPPSPAATAAMARYIATLELSQTLYPLRLYLK